MKILNPARRRAGLDGLIGIVTWALDNRRCRTGYIVRSFLLSLYSADSEYPCDLAAVQFLDDRNVTDLAKLLTGIGRDVWDYEIREAVAIIGGETGLQWFFEPLGGLDRDLLSDCMASAEGKLVC